MIDNKLFIFFNVSILYFLTHYLFKSTVETYMYHLH
jgi:hypothetical protein